MKTRTIRRVACVTIVACLSLPGSAHAHHSFAMYDQTETRTLTGRLTRYIPGANHAQLIFEVLDEAGDPVLDDAGEPLLWGVETGPASRIARQGVTPDNFPVGTIITVSVHPLRDGRPFGALPNGAPLINCGTEMPEGGCTSETGEAYLADNN